MSFDLEGARRAGYSDAEIADFLAQRKGFDAAGARQAGYNDQELVDYLLRLPEAPEDSAVEPTRRVEGTIRRESFSSAGTPAQAEPAQDFSTQAEPTRSPGLEQVAERLSERRQSIAIPGLGVPVRRSFVERLERETAALPPEARRRLIDQGGIQGKVLEYIETRRQARESFDRMLGPAVPQPTPPRPAAEPLSDEDFERIVSELSAERERLSREDSWAEVLRKTLRAAPERFQQQAGGLLQALGESDPVGGYLAERTGDVSLLDPLNRPDVQAIASRTGREPQSVVEEAREERRLSPPAQTGARIARGAAEEIAANAPQVEPGSLKYYASAILDSVLNMAPGVAATILTRRPDVGVALMGSQVFGQKYAERRAQGATEDEAARDALFYASAEAVPERIPLGVLIREGRPLLSRALKSAGAEGVQEVFTEAAQIGYKRGILNEDIPLDEALARLRDAGIIGAGAGGALGIAAHPFARRGAAPPKVEGARPDAIRKEIRRPLNVPINEGGITSRRAAGIYKVKPRTIRVRNRNDVDVITHEVGHHFSESVKPVRRLMEAHERELLSLTPDAYAGESKALRREEGFAEFVRLYLTQRAHAKRQAPKFFDAFEGFIRSSGHAPILQQIHDQIDAWYRLNPADRILAKVGSYQGPPLQRLRQALDPEEFVFQVLDNWRPLKRMVRDLAPKGLAPSRDPYIAARLLAGDPAVIEDWIVRETIPFDFARRANPKDRGKPLKEILRPVAKDLDRFKAYLIARRAEELQRFGKERLFTPEEIEAGLSLETATFKRAAQEVFSYSDRLLDYAVEGGLISRELAQEFRRYTAYVPFFREQDAPEAKGAKASVFRRLKGGTQNLRDPVANLVENTARIIHATNRNAVLAKAYELAKQVPGGGRWVEEVPIPKRAIEVATETVLKELERQGVKIDPRAAEALAEMQTFWSRNLVGNDRKRIVIVRVNGEPKALQINDEQLWKALQAFEPVDLGFIGTLLSVPSDLLRTGVTLSPDFMARNFMRDTLSGFMQSKPGLVPVASTLQGFKEIATRSDVARLYRAFGGAYADLWRGEPEPVRKIVERMAKRGAFPAWSILTPWGWLDLLRRLGSISEAGTRVAEFKRTMRPGDVDSLIEAAFNAREVSVDFGLHGHHPAVRALTRITPFLNPAMQGLYKLARTGRERLFTTLLRGSLLAGFSVLLYLWNKDEDWYEEIEDWERNVYWHLDVGLRTPEGRVVPLRLPKPFEWGAVFGSFPEVLAEGAIRREPELAKRLRSILEDVFLLRAVPTALLVPLELWANINTFTDRPIVPESKQGLEPELQHGPSASLTARETGKLLKTSPAKIDHAIRGFFGTLGTYSVFLADQAVRLAGDHPEAPDWAWWEWPVIRSFAGNPNSPNSRYVTEFYELLDEARRKKATFKKLEPEEAEAYRQEHADLIRIAPAAETRAKALAKLRRENERLWNDPSISGAEKLRRISENNRQIRELAKGFVKETEAKR